MEGFGPVALRSAQARECVSIETILPARARVELTIFQRRFV